MLLTAMAADQSEDLEDIVAQLRSLGWHIRSIVGHSKAGTVVVQYAAVCCKVPSIVAVSARFFQDQGR